MLEAERLTVPAIRNVILNFFEQRGIEVQKTVEDNVMTPCPICNRTVYLLQNEQISRIMTKQQNRNKFSLENYGENYKQQYYCNTYYLREIKFMFHKFSDCTATLLCSV